MFWYRLSFSSAIIALLMGFTPTHGTAASGEKKGDVPCDGSAAPAIMSTEGENWQMDICVSDTHKSWIPRKAEWTPNAPLTIKPTRMDGARYIPRSLRDAWRELDRMLPRSFVRDRIKNSSYKRCVLDTLRPDVDPELALHNYVHYAWLGDRSSRLWTF